jgi:hypothetical protein
MQNYDEAQNANATGDVFYMQEKKEISLVKERPCVHMYNFQALGPTVHGG